MIIYRVIAGKEEGREGTPKSRTKDGKRISLMIGGTEYWLDRKSVTRLACLVMNCRNYTRYMMHSYCDTCLQEKVDVARAYGSLVSMNVPAKAQGKGLG